MSVLKSVRLRITSIKNTQQITKAMKMVSASKLRRSQQGMEELKPFALHLQKMVERLLAMPDIDGNPFYRDFEKSENRTRILVISTDKGLCGALNANVFKKLNRYIDEELTPKGIKPSLILFGKKAVEYYKNRPYPILAKFSDMKENVLKEKLLTYIRSSIQQYTAHEFDDFLVAYNQFHSIIKQEATVAPILPINMEGVANATPDDEVHYEFEPDAYEIIKSLIPIYVESKALRALLENIASEHAARMTAMDSASKNAGDILAALQLQYNRARQAMITKELIEIISGAESLQ